MNLFLTDTRVDSGIELHFAVDETASVGADENMVALRTYSSYVVRCLHRVLHLVAHPYNALWNPIQTSQKSL